MGDITIDFMNMIDVMVDVMVMATGTGDGNGGNNNNNNNNNNGEAGEGGGDAGDGGNNNNNNNNNNNPPKRRKRGLNSLISKRLDIIDSALESFEEQPVNSTMVENLEILAKNHITQYLQTLKSKENHSSLETTNLIGSRSLKRPRSRQIMIDSVAIEFFGRLMESYNNFKDYCEKTNHLEYDCAILQTDWEMLGKRIKD